jgi:cytochrome c peroxidase
VFPVSAVVATSSTSPAVPPVVTIGVTGTPLLPGDVALGRRLFHAVGGRRIAFDGRACASCHPDGRDDALTWSTPEGPRQTPMLLGRLEGTGPYGWDGDGKDLASHFARTMQRLGGTGVSAGERDALFAYLRSLVAPTDARRQPAVDAKVSRGSELFHAESTGCSSCHLGEETSTDGSPHDVGTASRFDHTNRFDTVSLRFVAKSAPYVHDG